jgi:hypothetical protein
MGDCFVVVNKDGESWDGEKWVNSWTEALQFRGHLPGQGDAYERCEREALRAFTVSGRNSSVAYISRKSA